MNAALSSTEICVFDAYGTLYDFNSAVARHRDAIGPKADALSEMWRTKQVVDPDAVIARGARNYVRNGARYREELRRLD